MASSAQERAVLHPADSACWTQGPPALTLLWASADAAEIDGKTEASELKNQVTRFLKAASDFLFLLCTWAMSHCGLVENIPDLDPEHVGLSVVSISDNLTLIPLLSRASTPHSGNRHGFLSAYFTEMLNQGRQEVKSFINDKDFLQIQILFYIFI